MPQQTGTPKVATQSGVGLCAYKTTDQKAEAATVFANWFTEEQRNMGFVLSTGYMPVRIGAFTKINENTFKSDEYRNLYKALTTTIETCSFKKEPSFEGYYTKVYALYKKIRNIQNTLEIRYKKGATCEQIVAEMETALSNVG